MKDDRKYVSIMTLILFTVTSEAENTSGRGMLHKRHYIVHYIIDIPLGDTLLIVFKISKCYSIHHSKILFYTSRVNSFIAYTYCC